MRDSISFTISKPYFYGGRGIMIKINSIIIFSFMFLFTGNIRAQNAPTLTRQKIYPTVGNSGHDQVEVQIAVNKRNPQNLILQSRNGQPALFAVSHNGGSTWEINNGENVVNFYDPDGYHYTYNDDPSVTIDADGNLYVGRLASTLQKSTDGGVSWPPAKWPINNGVDRPLIAADDVPTSTWKNRVYWTFYNYGRNNNNFTWIDYKDQTSEFVTEKYLGGGVTTQLHDVETGPNGEVYLCYVNSGSYNQIGFAKSTDGGTTFVANDNIQTISTLTGTAPGAEPYSGILGAQTGLRTLSSPALAVDRGACSKFGGRIYLVSAVNTSSGSNYSSVVKCWNSKDQGTTWNGNGVVCSLPNAKFSLQPWVAVDDVSGIVCVVYYCQNTSVPKETNTYVAYSTDGGNTFSNIKVSDASFIMGPRPESNNTVLFGNDYIGITGYNHNFYAVWADYRDQNLPNTGYQLYMCKLAFTPSDFHSIYDIHLNGVKSYTAVNSFRANHEIIMAYDNQSVTCQSSSKVEVKAGTSIILKPGFSAFSGSAVTISLASCGTGTFPDYTTNLVQNLRIEDDTQTVHNTVPQVAPSVENKSTWTRPVEIFDVYPNPASKTTQIRWMGNEEIAEVILYDGMGKEIRKIALSDLKNINVSDLKEGMYLLTLKTTSGKLHTTKFYISPSATGQLNEFRSK